VGAVEVPGIAGPACTATRLVVGHVPARARVIGLLGLPGHDTALDVDLPRARTRAVHAVRAAHDLVVRPALAVGVLPGTVFAGGTAVIAGKAFPGQAEMGQAVEEVAHRLISFSVDSAGHGGMATGVVPPGHGHAQQVEGNKDPQRGLGAAGGGDGAGIAHVYVEAARCTQGARETDRADAHSSASHY